MKPYEVLRASLCPEGRKAVPLAFATHRQYFNPEIVSKMIDELEIAVRLHAMGMEDLTECQRVIAILLIESAGFDKESWAKLVLESAT